MLKPTLWQLLTYGKLWTRPIYRCLWKPPVIIQFPKRALAVGRQESPCFLAEMWGLPQSLDILWGYLHVCSTFLDTPNFVFFSDEMAESRRMGREKNQQTMWIRCQCFLRIQNMEATGHDWLVHWSISETYGAFLIWVCLKMLCTPKPNGFADHYPY